MRKEIDNSNTHHLIPIFAISLVCIIIYSNTLNSSFVFDDFHNIRENPHIRLTDLSFEKLYNAGFKSPVPSRPVANISFALNYYFGKYDVTGYHLVNIFLHLVNGILVYFLALNILRQVSDLPSPPAIALARSGQDGTSLPPANGWHRRADQAIAGLAQAKRAGPNPPIPKSASPPERRRVKETAGKSLNSNIPLISLFAALLFTAHPLQTQSVTYIVQRMNSMAVMFYFLSLILYIYGRLSRVMLKRWALWTGCFVSWILAFGSKEIAATLPFTLLLYELYFFQDLKKDWFKRNFKYFLGLIVLLGVLVFLYLGGHPFENIITGYTHRDFTMWERVITQFRVVLIYLSLLFYPHPSRLNVIHRITTSHSLLDPITTLFSFLTIVSLIGLAIYFARKQRIISFCVIWFFTHLVIESTIVGLEMVFEHRLYLPIFGFALFVASILFHFLSKKRTWAFIISVSIIISLGTATYLRNSIWQDRIALWIDVLSKNPQSHRAHYNLGSDLVVQGSLEKAISHYSEAIRIKPNYARAHNNLGVALEGQGRLEEAIDHYHEALRIRPDFAEAHYNYGVALEGQGRLEEAMGRYQEALRFKPDFAEAHNNLGVALEGLGRFEEAVSHYSKALLIKSDDAEAYNNLGVALEGLGKYREAIDNYFEALRIKPDYMEAYNNLGVALTRQGGLKEAIRCYQEALKIDPDDAGVHNNLGVVLVRQGKLEEAIGHYSKALRINPDYSEAHNNLGIALTRRGNLREAVDHFKEALRIKPDDTEARKNLELGLGLMDKSEGTSETIVPTATSK